MKVAICTASAHKEVYQTKLEQFARGVIFCGDSTDYTDTPNVKEHDTAVIYGSFKRYRGAPHHRIKCSVADNFKQFVQLETPVIGRSAVSIDHLYLRVGVNGFLWDEATWGFDYIDSTRYLKVFSNCGYSTETEWKTNGSHILILMQNPGDASLRGQDIYQWCYQTVEELQRHTDRPIRIRPHPLPRKGFKSFAERVSRYKNVELVENELPDRLRPLAMDFEDCYCAVSFSSGSAVDAVLAGVPSLTTNSGNMAWLVSQHELKNIESRYLGDRTEWMQKIAMCQWSTAEFESGECWSHIRQSLK
jgi:hypothetical protein